MHQLKHEIRHKFEPKFRSNTCLSFWKNASGQQAHMQTKTKNTHNPQSRPPTSTHALACVHLTWIETTGCQFSPLTGSIRGQSAAEPHAVQPQRDTLDYRKAARHTMVRARLWWEAGWWKQQEGETGRGLGWWKKGIKSIFIKVPFL